MKRFFFLLISFLAAGGAFGVELIPFTAQGPYPSQGVEPDSLDFAWTAIDETLNATFVCTGKEVLLIRNPTLSTSNFTIVSVTDEFGAKGDISGYIASSSVCAFYFGSRKGWDAGSGVLITSTTTGIELAAARLPQIFKPVSSATTASRFAISNILGPYPSPSQATAAHLELKMSTAGYITDGTFPISGREILIVHNSSSLTSYGFKIWSNYKNSYQRQIMVPNNQTYYDLGAGEWACWVLSTTEGWMDEMGFC